jgi:hypothetical protein
MGFVASLIVSSSIVSQQELALQIVPFLCGLALIPLAAWVTTRLTGRWELALLAAVVVGLHPFGGPYSVRVKQFTWDAAVFLGLVGLGLPELDPQRRPRPWRLALTSALALPLSYTSVFAGAVLCQTRALMSLVRRSDLRRRDVLSAAGAALTWDAFAALFYALRLRGQSGGWVREYWQRFHAFPTAAPSLAGGIDLTWLVPATKRAYGTWLRYGRWWLVALAAVGIAYLLLQKRRRWQGLFLAVFCALPPLAGSWLLFPFGGGRTDFYFQPLLAVLGSIGVGALAHLLAATWIRIRLRPTVADPLRIAVTLTVLAFCLLIFRLPPTVYGGGDITAEYRNLVATFDEIVQPDDFVLLTPFSLWNVAYYTRHPLRIDFARPGDRRFFQVDLRHRSRHAWRLRAELAAPDLPDRVVFVALLSGARAMRGYEEQFEQAGYQLAYDKAVFHAGAKTSAVQIWTKPSSASQPDA